MKILSVIICAALLFACNPSNNSPGERGAINDGFDGAGDANGALQDTGYKYTPQTDTGIGESRVDVQPRNEHTNQQ